MKKVLILLILIPITALAEFWEGTVTFTDGTTKKGYITIPDQPNNSNLRFKLEENSKIEKLQINTIKGFEISNNQKEIVQYETIFVAYNNPFNPNKLNINKRKSWARIVKEGKITLYALDKLNYNLLILSTTTFYCIKKQNEDFALYLGDYMYGSEGNWHFNLNNFKLFKNTIRHNFEKECPQLADLIDKEDFIKNGMGRIVELYDQNCE